MPAEQVGQARRPVRKLVVVIAAALIATLAVSFAVRFGQPRTLRDRDFAITFEYPGNFWRDDRSVEKLPDGSREVIWALGTNSHNGIIVRKSPVQVQDLNRAKLDFDKGFWDERGVPPSRLTTVAGQPAFDYGWSAFRNPSLDPPGHARRRFVVVFLLGSEYYTFTCQSTLENYDKMRKACDLALTTASLVRR